MKRVLSLLIALVLCALPALSEAPDETELLRRENEMLKTAWKLTRTRASSRCSTWAR